MSLSNLLDINQPQDLLRGIIHTLAEHDQAKEDTDKSKIVRFFTPNVFISLNQFLATTEETISDEQGWQETGGWLLRVCWGL